MPWQLSCHCMCKNWDLIGSSKSWLDQIVFQQDFSYELIIHFWHEPQVSLRCGQISLMPGARFTKIGELKIEILWKWLLLKFYHNNLIRSQICTCHDHSHAITCAQLWFDWIIIFQVTATSSFPSFGWWAPEPFVKRAPGCGLTGVGEYKRWHNKGD